MSAIQGTPVRLDVAIDRLLVEPVDHVTRGELQGLQTHIRRDVQTNEQLDPPNLIGLVFGAIMPRISHPDVLRLDRRQKVLERMEARAAAGSKGDPLLAGGLVILRHELQNLALLRRHRDRLIEG